MHNRCGRGLQQSFLLTFGTCDVRLGRVRGHSLSATGIDGWRLQSQRKRREEESLSGAASDRGTRFVEVDRLVVELLNDSPRIELTFCGDSPSFARRRWIASRQAKVDRIVAGLLTESPPPFHPEPDFEGRLAEFVERLLRHRETTGEQLEAELAVQAGATI